MRQSILVVDDEICVAESIKLKIKRLHTFSDYEVTVCTSAKLALSQAQEHTFSLIMTDIRMPFMTGTQLIRRLRERGYKGPILVLSGYDDFEYVREAFVNGADDYMLKPVALRELEQKLDRFLKEKQEESGPEIQEDAISRNDIIAYALRYINDNYKDSSLTMEDVAKHISISYGHFSALFRKETGTTFPSYLRKLRIEKAIGLLEDPSLKISDICYQVGFKYPQQFSNDFKRETGVYPSQYQHEKPKEKED
ncbi:MAG: response regulator [Clostridium sp.]|nr:response regulator [Clostridium sp.]